MVQRFFYFSKICDTVISLSYPGINFPFTYWQSIVLKSQTSLPVAKSLIRKEQRVRMRTFRLSVVTAHPALTQARTAWCVTFRFRVTCSLALFLPLSGPPGVRCLFFLPHTLSEGQIFFSGFWVILPQIRLTLVWNVVSQSSFLANSKNGTHSLWAWKRNREKSKMIPRLLGRMVVIISPS